MPPAVPCPATGASNASMARGGGTCGDGRCDFGECNFVPCAEDLDVAHLCVADCEDENQRPGDSTTGDVPEVVGRQALPAALRDLPVTGVAMQQYVFSQVCALDAATSRPVCFSLGAPDPEDLAVYPALVDEGGLPRPAPSSASRSAAAATFAGRPRTVRCDAPAPPGPPTPSSIPPSGPRRRSSPGASACVPPKPMELCTATPTVAASPEATGAVDPTACLRRSAVARPGCGPATATTRAASPTKAWGPAGAPGRLRGATRSRSARGGC